MEKKAKQKCMTQDMLLNMVKRMMAKSNVDEYNKIGNEIKSECQLVKDRILTELCENIEQLEAAHKSHHIHAQIR